MNLAREKSKSGCLESELPRLIEVAQKQVKVELRGLMFMPPLDMKDNDLTEFYRKAYQLGLNMKKYLNPPHSLVELSMGTSHDFELAIREGATMVRLGSILFGERSH